MSSPKHILCSKYELKRIHFYGEQEGGTGSVWGAGTHGRGEDVGRRCRKKDEYHTNIVYTCM
jgi:hypothetical protein